MEAAEGTAAGPEGTARGSERRGLRPAALRESLETLAAYSREATSAGCCPDPLPSRAGPGAALGAVFMAEPPGAAGRDGAGRGARPGGPGRRGGRGVPLGQGQRQPGCEQGCISPGFFSFLSSPPCRRAAESSRPDVPKCRVPPAGDRSVAAPLAHHSEEAASSWTGLSATTRVITAGAFGHHGTLRGAGTVRDRGTPRGGAGHSGARTPRGGAGHRRAGTPRGAAGYGGGHPVALRACPSGKRRRARGVPACLPSGIPANAGVPGSSPSSPSLGNLCRDGSHSVAFCSRDKDLFLAVGQFGAWENGVGFRNIPQGCRSFCSGFLSII